MAYEKLDLKDGQNFTAEHVAHMEEGIAKANSEADKFSGHNTSEESHNDIRILISELTVRLNTLANSDDTTLDQMAEIVAYIKSNKSLIDGITTNKINVSDIIDNLTTNNSKKPLSAKQGVQLKALIEAIVVPTKTSQLYDDVGFAKQTAIDGLLEEIADEVTARQNAITDLKAQGIQQTPLFAQGDTLEEALAWLETNGDKTKMYGMHKDVSEYIFAYIDTEIETEAPELYNESTLALNTRVNSSNAIVTGAGYIMTPYIAIDLSISDPVVLIIEGNINLRGTDPSYQRISYYDSNKTIIGSHYIDTANALVEMTNGVMRLSIGRNKNGEKLSYYNSIAFVRVDMYTGGGTVDSGAGYFESIIVEGSGGTSVGKAWASTGHTLFQLDANLEQRVLDVERDSADHETRIKELESATESDTENADVPSYWLEELKEKAETIQLAMESAGRNKSAFLWYTDAHWSNGNSKVSPLLLKWLQNNTPMNKTNFCGDILGNSLLDRTNMGYLYEWRRMIRELINHHSAVGNHDYFADYAYAFLIAPEESSDMVVGGDFYYYIDNPSEKTRYLYIDNMTTDNTELNAQADFLQEALESVPTGWHIVAISHRWFQYISSSNPTVGSVPIYTQEILDFFDAYNARSNSTEVSNLGYFPTFNFANATGKVEFCIGGHIHVDYDFASTGGIPIILTASDVNQERSGNETEDSGTLGTITESAVYGIVADYNNNKISVIGVGRGGSRTITI